MAGRRREDITGNIYAMAGVTAISFHNISKTGKARWVFQCNECGHEAVALASSIKRGKGISCKCKKFYGSEEGSRKYYLFY